MTIITSQSITRAPQSTTTKDNPIMFTKIKHYAGVVIAKCLSILNTTDKAVDKYAPQIEKDLLEGASIADFIPNIGPEVAAGLNLGAELTGALEKTIDECDTEFAAFVQKAEAALPANSGLAVVLVPAQIKQDAKQFFSQIKSTLEGVKAAAQTSKAATSSPSSESSPAAANTSQVVSSPA